MIEHFISRTDAESDLLSCAAYLSERITSIDGRAEAMSAVVPQYIGNGKVDLAAELANTVDDPYTRDRLLTAVAEKCAQQDDEEYALQLADAIEDAGLRSEALERVALQLANQDKFDAAREIATNMGNPDGILVGIAVKQAAIGLEEEALQTIEEIEHSASAVTALFLIAGQNEDKEKAAEYLERALEEAEGIEHNEEAARAFCDLGSAFINAERNDRAIVSFDKAKATAETIENVHRDGFLSLAAQGLLQAGSLELADRTLDLIVDKTSIASCLLGYAREFWRKDDRTEAVEALEEAYAMLESQHERETREAKARFRLFTAIAAQFAGFEKGERAIEIAEKIKDETERTSALTQVAGILALRNQDDEARHAFRSINDDGDRAFALIGMSDAKARNEDREAALTLLNEADALVNSVPQLTMQAAAFVEIGRRFSSYGETESAASAFENAIRIAGEIRDESIRVTTLVSLVDATSGLDLNLSILPKLVSG